jgi:L-fuconolactonase
VIIDAHHHVWDPAARRHAWLDGLPELRRRFGLDDFRQPAAAEGVTASILVQVLADTAETEEFLALAAANGAGQGGPALDSTAGHGTDSGGTDAGPGRGVAVAGVVGWVDLGGPDVAEEIARLRQLPGGDRLAGIRHLVQDEPDPAWLDRAEVRRGLRAVSAAGLVYDLLIRPSQLPAALRLAGDLDSVAFVLDHAAKPQIAAGRLQPWAGLITGLAARPNVACKVSGLVTEAAAGWRPEQFVPYVDTLVESFGPGRLMFGSDWPVCLLAATYAQVLSLATGLLSRQLSPAEVDAVLAATARSVYGLHPAHVSGGLPSDDSAGESAR